MDNIKIGSIVRCNNWSIECYDPNGLVYDLRWVDGQRHPIATVAFEYEPQMREIPIDLLTSVGEIEPEYAVLNYRPGTRLKLHEGYIVDHIELTPKTCQFDQDPVLYKVFAIVIPDEKGKAEQMFEDGCITEIYAQIAKNLLNTVYGVPHSKTLKEEINMCMSKAKDTRIPTNPFYNPIKKVIFNDPATIVFWEDGTKTIVKCQEGVTFDPEKGLAMAISRHYLCDICGLERYDGVFKRYVSKEMKK